MDKQKIENLSTKEYKLKAFKKEAKKGDTITLEVKNVGGSGIASIKKEVTKL